MFANHLDFQDRLDAWTEKANRRVHRTVRAVPAERLAEEQRRMRPLPARMPDTNRRHVVRVAAQPLMRVDRNDYSVDPAFAGRRVEVRVSQTEVTAVVLDTGELAARHRRVFAGGLTLTDAAHQSELKRQRGQAPPSGRDRGRDPAARALRRSDRSVVMVSHRSEIDASAGPAREGVLCGRAMLLVRVRLFDGPGVACALTGEPGGDEDVYTDLRPEAARDLALRLLECAEHAEQVTEHAGWWQR